LLLISADLIADHTCYDIEINRAMERYQARRSSRHPDLLRPSRLGKVRPFSQLACVTQKPASCDKLEPFQEIAEGIRAVAIELRRTKGAGA
jgi:hypothetical protein